ncbi:hypothetical protein AGABI2DRAFT_201698 [Agaricus bisporus var. bisporus H97]|uniref:hypothetical protein n=1 Tax=Agaricus bisporus var. bisporus (strain H97 / ATCC MYA-4626 / FGSC 10389) TaxID=936046 RepID=UPI00029F6045|nr:hypothetical protein AGABI2DRAFT_201698 [Agaricus bisporus var. bisporus H97]EKV49367.1 hypothetical protein AGABI2DRAFT_201698 [Agaricus bisporus var. bisporus H97]
MIRESLSSGTAQSRNYRRVLPSLSSSDDMIIRFQEGKLRIEDQEWHRLVPEGAQDALGKKEVRRQSIIFEIIKGERDYVNDLELVQQLYIDGIRRANPHIIPERRLPGFITDVFGNFHEILNFHQHLLKQLFARQREQHPVLQTVGDIILDQTLKSEFRSAYETYIKRYPMAESYHRNELKCNRAYERFLQTTSNDARVRKRDLITLLSRPVTKLPRLNLLLEEALKSTEQGFEHPDLEALPLILGILNPFIKSTQPGIEAAEGKVKFWSLCESLVYQKGEIIDMDFYDESRTLVYSSSVARRVKSEASFHEWEDLALSLLDNYVLITREENSKPNNSVIKRHLVSRPIPLSFLRLAGFADPTDSRRERSEDRRLLDSLWSHSVPIYPFTIYHASSRISRRYTLYVESETQRQKWQSVLSECIAVHRVREDSNKWFEAENISSRFFRVPDSFLVSPATSDPPKSGRITSAVPFCFDGRKFLAVGCPTGIYVSVAGHEAFKKALDYSNPKYIGVLQAIGDKVFNKFIVHSDQAVTSYSLELLARLALDQTNRDALSASTEKVGGDESNIVICKCAQVNGRALVIYATKRRLSTTLTLHVMEAVTHDQIEINARRKISSFKPCSEPGFIPRDTSDIVPLARTLAVCSQDKIVVVDPINLSQSAVAVVPDLRNTMSSVLLSTLQDRIRHAKALGLVRVDAHELLMIYDSIGYYVTKQGVPTRSFGYIRWETPVSAFAQRGNNIVLVSSRFIEIRDIATGKIVQVLEGADVRLMYSGPPTHNKDDRILLAMRGSKGQDGSFADRLVELIETVEYVPQTPAMAEPVMWTEWDL